MTKADAAEADYRDALRRLEDGTPRLAEHKRALRAGKVVRITPSSVAREAGHSRNPLYQNARHKALLTEIEQAGQRQAERLAGGGGKQSSRQPTSAFSRRKAATRSEAARLREIVRRARSVNLELFRDLQTARAEATQLDGEASKVLVFESRS